MSRYKDQLVYSSNLICIGAKEQEVEGDGRHQVDDEPAPTADNTVAPAKMKDSHKSPDDKLLQVRELFCSQRYREK
jgi:hypothetical protein